MQQNETKTLPTQKEHGFTFVFFRCFNMLFHLGVCKPYCKTVPTTQRLTSFQVCFSSFVECLQLKTVCQRPLATKRCFYRTLLIDCSFFHGVKKTLHFKKPNRKTTVFNYIKGNLGNTYTTNTTSLVFVHVYDQLFHCGLGRPFC